MGKIILEDDNLDPNFSMVLIDEAEIDWHTQHEIHHLLNVCYEGLTKQFYSKTYAYMRPTQRILVYENSNLVGHCGLNTNEVMNLREHPVKVGCIGLMAAKAKTKICLTFLKMAIKVHSKNGCAFSIGYSSNKAVIRKIFPKAGGVVLDIPTVGKNSRTKPVDKTVVFPNCPGDDLSFVSDLKEIIVLAEIF